MENQNNLKTTIFNKISDLMLSYPEFAFFMKIVGGLTLVGIIYLIVKFFTKV
jgi:hypothetical protein